MPFAAWWRAEGRRLKMPSSRDSRDRERWSWNRMTTTQVAPQSPRWVRLVVMLALASVSAGLFVAFHPSLIGIDGPTLMAPPIIGNEPGVVTGFLLMAVGALVLAHLTGAPGPRMSTTLPVPKPRWRPAALAAMLVGAASSVALWANLPAERFPWWNGLLFVVTIAGGGVALHLWDRTGRRTRPFAAVDLALAAGCAAVSAAVNCIGLVRWNFSFIGDEGAFFFHARSLAEGEVVNLFDLTWVYQTHPALDSFYQARALRLFGADVWGWRIGEVLVVAAVAAMVCLLGILLFDRLTGMAAAVVVGASHYLFAFTRIGYNNLHALFWSTLAMLMIALAWRTRRAVFTWLAGCAVGMCLYTFFVAVLIGPILAVLLGLGFLRRPSGKQAVAGLLLVVGFAVVVLPGLISTPPSELEEIIQRESIREHSAADPLGTFIYSSTRSLVSFFVNPEWHNHYVGTAVLDPLSSALLAVGLAAAVLGVRRRGERTLLVWYGLGLVLLARTAYLPTPQLTRLLFLMPPAALLAGLGARTVYRAITRGIGSPRWVGCTVLSVVLIGMFPLNAAILHRLSPARIWLDPTALAFKAAMDHPDDTVIFTYAERNQNLVLMLECYPDIDARVAVIGLDELQIPPPASEGSTRPPIYWTCQREVFRVLEKALGDRYRVELDATPAGEPTAWLFVPE